jgi:hypothetical protein
MMLISSTKIEVLRSSGKVIFQKRVHLLCAPSTCAASYKSGDIACIPAMNTIM